MHKKIPDNACGVSGMTLNGSTGYGVKCFTEASRSWLG
jgi:hypothetical protein